MHKVLCHAVSRDLFIATIILSQETLLTIHQVSATYAFGATEGNVGETLSSQLTLSSQAHKTSRPVVISYIEVLFEGGLKGFRIAHSPDNPPDISSGPGPAHIQPVDLQKLSSETLSITSSPLTAQRLSDFGTADLALAAGATKALSFDHVPRDAGKTEVACVTLYIKEDDFDLEYVVSDDEQLRQDIIWVQHEAGVSQKRLKNGRSTMVTVLPKPPKLRLELHDVMPAYFSNEEITIEFTIRNEEDDETDVTLDARLLGPASSLPDMTWALDDEIPGSFDASEAGDLLDFAGSLLPPKRLGKMQSFEERRSTIHIHATPEPVNFSLEIRATYHVHLDPETTLSKAVSSNISIARPFEASYNFLPLPCSEPWPNYFDSLSVNDGSDSDGSSMQMASGLIQQWSLTSRLASLAEVPLIIDSLELRMAEVPERAVCNILSTSTSSMEALLLSPRDLREHNHTIKVQKVDMDDRQVTFLNLQLEVRWHRDGLSLPPTTTRIAVPELVVPFGEPRVLASSSNAKFPPGVIHLDYVIENPSTYTLTFNLSMETSEEFAFSGPKNVSVQLVPLSRHEVRYNIMPVVKGLWISPQFRVYDTHFHKILKVNATEGMRNDKKGVSVWVDADG